MWPEYKDDDDACIANDLDRSERLVPKKTTHRGMCCVHKNLKLRYRLIPWYTSGFA